MALFDDHRGQRKQQCLNIYVVGDIPGLKGADLRPFRVLKDGTGLKAIDFVDENNQPVDKKDYFGVLVEETWDAWLGFNISKRGILGRPGDS